MTYLHELKVGEFVRIVQIENRENLTNRLDSVLLLEGSFIKIVSRSSDVVFSSDGKTYVISKGLAEKIRVIMIDCS